jgi:hypothetical protein
MQLSLRQSSNRISHIYTTGHKHFLPSCLRNYCNHYGPDHILGRDGLRFLFRIDDCRCSGDPSLIGDVLELVPEGENSVYNLSPFPNTLVPTANGIFYLTSAGVLVANGPHTSGAFSGGGTDGSVLCFATAAAEQEFGLVPLVCSIDSTGLVTCMDGTDDGFDYWAFCLSAASLVLMRMAPTECSHQ